MTKILYHCQFYDFTITEDPYDVFIWAVNDLEAKKLLKKSVDEDETFKANGVTAECFHIYTVYAENGGQVSQEDATEGQVWFSPSRIAELGLIKDTRGSGNYRMTIRLIKEGKLKAKKEKGGFLVHRDWIDEYNRVS